MFEFILLVYMILCEDKTEYLENEGTSADYSCLNIQVMLGCMLISSHVLYCGIDSYFNWIISLLNIVWYLILIFSDNIL